MSFSTSSPALTASATRASEGTLFILFLPVVRLSSLRAHLSPKLFFHAFRHRFFFFFFFPLKRQQMSSWGRRKIFFPPGFRLPSSLPPFCLGTLGEPRSALCCQFSSNRSHRPKPLLSLLQKYCSLLFSLVEF